MFSFFKAWIMPSSQNQLLQPNNTFNQANARQEAKCYLTLHTPDNKPFPINEVIKGEWNALMQKQFSHKYNPHQIFTTIDEAIQYLYAKTQSANHKAAYILCLGFEEMLVKKLIASGDFNKAIINALNYKDVVHLRRTNAKEPIEIVSNLQFSASVAPNQESLEQQIKDRPLCILC